MHEHDDESVGGPEVDNSSNPTAAAPGDRANDYGGGRASEAARSGEEAWDPGSEAPASTRGAGSREMLVQLQQMIDTVATQAAPVMREVAAKAAELAAVAGEKAGPVAYRAAGVAQNVGERVAARSKEMADQWRRPPEPGTVGAGEPTTDAGSDTEATASTDADRTDDPKSSDWSAS
jgi:hypothetical protein